MSTEYGKTSSLLDIEKNPCQKHVNKIAVIYFWRSQRGGEAHEILCGFADGCGWFLGVIFFWPYGRSHTRKANLFFHYV